MTEFSFPLRVYIEDTDSGGIVYYVNYLKYMERARTEYMRHLGYDKSFIFNREMMFVVHSSNVRYLSPARLDEELVATARPIKCARTYIIFEQLVRRGDDLLCRAEIKIACVAQGTLKPMAIPAEILQQLKADEMG